MYFYRDSNGNEVDLLIKRGAQYDCFEIKSAETFHKDFAKGLNVFENGFPELVRNKTVIYSGDSQPVLPIRFMNYNSIP